jgi:hypothetical protein
MLQPVWPQTNDFQMHALAGKMYAKYQNSRDFSRFLPKPEPPGHEPGGTWFDSIGYQFSSHEFYVLSANSHSAALTTITVRSVVDTQQSS